MQARAGARAGARRQPRGRGTRRRPPWRSCPRSSGGLPEMFQVDYGLTSGRRRTRDSPWGCSSRRSSRWCRCSRCGASKPSLLLRQDVPAGRGIDWPGEVGHDAGRGRRSSIGVAAWQAGSLRAWACCSRPEFVATAVVLHLAGVALIWAVQPLRFARNFAVRHAVLHIVRPGNRDARRSCWPWASASSSSSACGACRRTCFVDFAIRAPTHPTCS